LGILLALGSALAWGAGDFLGGLASRRIPALPLALRAHAVGLAGLLGVELVLLRTGMPGGAVLAWGALAGLAGGAGIWLFYRSLAMGTMSVVAPVSGVTAAVVPVAVGIATGERPGALAIVGIAVALTAIGLVGAGTGGGAAAPAPGQAGTARPTETARPAAARTPGPPGSERPARATAELSMSVGSGVGFGLFAVAIARAGDDAGLWQLISGRAASVAAFAVASLLVGRRAASGRPVRHLVVATALLDSGANVLYLFAAGRGLLSIVGAIVAMYPATTVVLARTVLGERLARCQQVGLGFAAAAVLLVAGG
jgi:drug/metabolite transporter (DMT)-like permease